MLLRIVSLMMIVLIISSPIASSKEIIRIGAVDPYGNEDFEELWQPTLAYLAENLPEYNFKLSPIAFSQVKNVVQEQQVEFLICNTYQFVDLAAEYELNTLATLRHHHGLGGELSYGSAVFTRADKPIFTWQDFSGKSVGAVEPNSLGGWLAALRELKTVGLGEKDFSKVEFVGTHLKVIDTVLAGRVDIGVVRTGVLEDLINKNLLDINKIRLIKIKPETRNFNNLLSTRSYPDWSFVKLAHVKDTVAKQVVTQLLQVGSKKGQDNIEQHITWSYPINNFSVYELQMELNTGKYRDFGKTNISNIYTKYRRWINAMLAIGFLLVSILLASVYYSRRLTKIQKQLDEELAKRKQTEAELRENEYKLLQAQSIGHMGSWEYSVKDQLTWGSEEAFRIYGLERTNPYLPLEVVRNVRVEADRLSLYSGLKNLLEKQIPYDMEYRIQRVNDQEIRHIHSKAELLYDNLGKPYKIVGIIQDITQQKKLLEKLREEEARFRAIFNSTNVGIAIHYLESGCFKMANAQFCKMTGYTEQELESISIYDLVHPDFHKSTQIFIEKLLKQELEDFTQQKTYLRKDGSAFWGEISVTCLENEQGEIEYTIGTIVDITERKVAEEELQASEQRFRLIAETSPIPLILTRPIDGKIFYMNKRFRDLFMVPYALQQEQYSLSFYNSLQDRDVLFKELVDKGEVKEREVLLKRYNGETFWGLVSVSATIYKNEMVCIAGVNDLSRQKNLEQELIEKATKDGLTGIANRRYFMEVCTREFTKAKRQRNSLAILIMDLDFFKKVNDTYGHHAGDVVLQQFAKLVATNIRVSDFLGRFGGEEFAVVLPNTDVDSAYKVAEKLRMLFAEKQTQVEDLPAIQCTVSIGLATLTEADKKCEDIISRADKALYLAKNSGRNCTKVL